MAAYGGFVRDDEFALIESEGNILPPAQAAKLKKLWQGVDMAESPSVTTITIVNQVATELRPTINIAALLAKRLGQRQEDSK